MRQIDTLGNEQLVVSPQGNEAVVVALEDPFFGRIATVRLAPEQASAFIEALWDVTLGGSALT
jgi:uncharacterized protein (DUF736 family)